MRTADPTAFDAIADTYDETFTRSTLGQLLRRRVWDCLETFFPAGSHVLELTCGTGEDALWLARRGVKVTATDGSIEMVRLATEKIAAAGYRPQVRVCHLTLQQFLREPKFAEGEPAYDGAFSNFGGLNTIKQWQGLAESLGKIIRPGGYLVLVPMGPFCPWEIGWYLLHGKLGHSFRRLNGPASARIGDGEISIWYPPARRLRRDFAPWFRPLCTESLGLWLPPSYLGHLIDRWPRTFSFLARLEQVTGRFTGGLGDHYIIIFRRR